MTPTDWDSGFGRAIAVFLNGNGIHGRNARGEAVTDRNFLVLYNAGDDAVDFLMPPDEYAAAWEIVVDTVGEAADSHPRTAGSSLSVEGKSMMVLRAHIAPPADATPDHSVAASLAPTVIVPSAPGSAAPGPVTNPAGPTKA
jgi:glycogen operon protein